jgi:hypothetical protein
VIPEVSLLVVLPCSSQDLLICGTVNDEMSRGIGNVSISCTGVLPTTPSTLSEVHFKASVTLTAYTTQTGGFSINARDQSGVKRPHEARHQGLVEMWAFRSRSPLTYFRLVCSVAENRECRTGRGVESKAATEPLKTCNELSFGHLVRWCNGA